MTDNVNYPSHYNQGEGERKSTMEIMLESGYQIDVDHIVSFTGDDRTGYAIDFDDKTSVDVTSLEMQKILIAMPVAQQGI